MTTRWPALVGCILVAGAPACGGNAFDSFVDQYARAFCHRTYQCCAPADRTGSASEADCAQMLAATMRQTSKAVIGLGLVRYDPDAGDRCLAHLQADACPSVFTRSFGRLTGCDNFLPGTGALGAVCDDDFVCASGDCEGQHCVVRPAGCPANQYRDSSTNQCQAGKGGGEPCVPGQCDSSLACVSGQCAEPLADGQPCTETSVCAGTCTVTQPGQGTGTCRPGICQGL